MGLDIAQIDAQGHKYQLNEFYIAHPEMMLGEMAQTGGRYEDALSAWPRSQL